MRTMFAVAIVSCSLAAGAAAGTFEGTLAFTEKDCHKVAKCVLKSPFGFVDSNGVGWQAPKGQWTNGASIPPELQPYFGSPFDADLVRAAVIHDHYCDPDYLGRAGYVKSWLDTHWVFYDALLASGVAASRAELMYVGVLMGGPKWIWLVEGKPCPIGRNCTQQVATAALPPGGSVKKYEKGETALLRPARYKDSEFAKEMEKAAAALKAKGEKKLSRVELEALAKSIRPGDPFLNGPEMIARPQIGIVE